MREEHKKTQITIYFQDTISFFVLVLRVAFYPPWKNTKKTFLNRNIAVLLRTDERGLELGQNTEFEKSLLRVKGFFAASLRINRNASFACRKTKPIHAVAFQPNTCERYIYANPQRCLWGVSGRNLTSEADFSKKRM
ncbi:MAG TPA: hypothetical protein DCE42_09990 [Myxococcales bacterium]|nr:hypothetical protein [Deltaproteobacteria bacterium]MBU52945.1 hypothetical protein [Deltaproteobacteria bacterium]HAA55079.1 hypothetical protein [Myxococcales bacterium]